MNQISINVALMNQISKNVAQMDNQIQTFKHFGQLSGQMIILKYPSSQAG
jgi:hypothetical protein